MEKKRKLPARAAARAEQIAKKRTVTPPETRSAAQAPAPAPTPTPVEEAPPPPRPLPKSIQPGKPLPTVETPQPDDLPSKEYQSVQESGVLAESLSRSRHKWITDSIFEKYWTKPSKKKGATAEDPNNPPKDSMMKVGQVTITVEPHVFEATMFVVKDLKPPPTTSATFRPIIQYGPPNGVMPPPATPKAAVSPPTTTAAQSPVQSQSQSAAPLQQEQPLVQETQKTTAPAPTVSPVPAASTPPVPPPAVPPVSAAAVSPAPAAAAPSGPMSSPRGMEMILGPSTATPQSAGPSSVAPPPIPGSAAGSKPYPSIPTPPTSSSMPAKSSAPSTPTTNARPSGPPVAAAPGAPAPQPLPGTDPIILTLAGKASSDPVLRDIMKRVAQGDANKQELEIFQSLIDEITTDSKRRGLSQGPSADRLLVDGRTVRYFADEVRAILDIVLSSNPKQKSADLRPPAGSDPLVVLLVKTALDEVRTREMVRRIAENRPKFSDATDLKAVLDQLKNKLAKQRERQTHSPSPSTLSTPTSARPSGTSSVLIAPVPGTVPAQPTQQQQQLQAPTHQALRSKGPPPPPRLDISAVVFEFSGGTGDRYLFPKFSVLEYVPVASGQQVVASFLIVRRGSQAEYPVADPELDYYQPLTVRLYTPLGRHLDHLAKVVAPQEEVRRYMDDIMDRMTRAEYVLLAMHLPRVENGAGKESEGAADDKDKDKEINGKLAAVDELRAIESQHNSRFASPQGSALWTAKAEAPTTSARTSFSTILNADEQYQSLIATVTPQEMEVDE